LHDRKSPRQKPDLEPPKMHRQLIPDSASWTNVIELLRWRATHQSHRPAFSFLVDGESDSSGLTYGELDCRARSIGASLQARAAPGSLALLLYPAGLEFIAAFFGCLYAGMVAIPAFPPDVGRAKRTLPRLRAIINDAQPVFALTETSLLS